MTPIYPERWENLKVVASACRTTLAILVRKALVGSEHRVWRRYLLDRWGIFWGRRLALKPGPSIVIFINAGEILGITVFCTTLRQLYPGHNLILAIDNTEAYLIGEQLELADVQIYSPWDFAWLGRRLQSRFRVDIAIFLTKIFHPTISRAWRQRGVVTGMVSGHFAPEMVTVPSNVPIWRRLFALRAYEDLDFLAMQTEEQKAELQKHVDRTDLPVLGNVRADVSHAAATEAEQAAFRRELRLQPDEPVVIAAATRGDEPLILDAFGLLASSRPDLRLVIVPRHVETAPRIVAVAREKGLNAVALHQLRDRTPVIVADGPIALAKLYSIASVVVFARTFQQLGGWANILEPAYHGRPIVFGSHLKLWPDGLEAVRARDPHVSVPPDARRLADSLAHFLDDRTAAREVGAHFRQLTQAGGAIAAANARFIYERSLRPGTRADLKMASSWAS